MKQKIHRTTVKHHKKDITLRDVVSHMMNMEQRLLGAIEENTKRIEENTKRIEENTKRIEENTQEIRKNSEDIQRLDRTVVALDQDLTATILDTVRIRRHVGLAVAEDE